MGSIIVGVILLAVIINAVRTVRRQKNIWRNGIALETVTAAKRLAK